MSLTSAGSRRPTSGKICSLHTRTDTPTLSPAEQHRDNRLCVINWVTKPNYVHKHRSAECVCSVSDDVTEGGQVELTFWYSSNILSTEPPETKSRDRLVNSSCLLDWAPHLHIKGTIHMKIQPQRSSEGVLLEVLCTTTRPDQKCFLTRLLGGRSAASYCFV